MYSLYLAPKSLHTVWKLLVYLSLAWAPHPDDKLCDGRSYLSDSWGVTVSHGA